MQLASISISHVEKKKYLRVDVNMVYFVSDKGFMYSLVKNKTFKIDKLNKKQVIYACQKNVTS